jgi:Fur family zinc uptake transcriptional regulator
MSDLILHRCNAMISKEEREVFVNNALKQADLLCKRKNVRLTPLRRQVLGLVWQNQKPAGAYLILDQLQKQQERRAAPPTVYRALEFLIEQGLIHKISSLNAFIACTQPDTVHVPQFFICKACGNALELNSPMISETILNRAQEMQFEIEEQVVEVSGQCTHCHCHLPQREEQPTL